MKILIRPLLHVANLQSGNPCFLLWRSGSDESSAARHKFLTNICRTACSPDEQVEYKVERYTINRAKYRRIRNMQNMDCDVTVCGKIAK